MHVHEPARVILPVLLTFSADTSTTYFSELHKQRQTLAKDGNAATLFLPKGKKSNIRLEYRGYRTTTVGAG